MEPRETSAAEAMRRGAESERRRATPSAGARSQTNELQVDVGTS